MCILLVAEGAKLRQVLDTHAALEVSMYARNPDGLGIMWHTDDGLVAVHKAMPKSSTEASDIIRATMPTDSRLVAVHYRQRTSGAIDESQCHPYLVHDGIYLMHNGVLDIDEPKPMMSDTWHFIRKYLRNMPSDIINNDSVRSMMGDLIGSGNRFVIATPGGNMHIINEATGYYHHDVWFSNHYAWDVRILVPDYYDRHGKRGKKNKSNNDRWYSYYSTIWGSDYEQVPYKDEVPDTVEEGIAVNGDDEWQETIDALTTSGYDTIMEWFGGYMPNTVPTEDWNHGVQDVYNALKMGQKAEVDRLCREDPAEIADWLYDYTGYLPVGV